MSGPSRPPIEPREQSGLDFTVDEDFKDAAEKLAEVMKGVG